MLADGTQSKQWFQWYKNRVKGLIVSVRPWYRGSAPWPLLDIIHTRARWRYRGYSGYTWRKWRCFVHLYTQPLPQMSWCTGQESEMNEKHSHLVQAVYKWLYLTNKLVEREQPTEQTTNFKRFGCGAPPPPPPPPPAVATRRRNVDGLRVGVFPCQRKSWGQRGRVTKYFLLGQMNSCSAVCLAACQRVPSCHLHSEHIMTDTQE